MTDATIPQASPVSTAGGRAGSAAADTGSDSAMISSDFDTFLRMLTAQVQNQDPLNPLDSTDFAVQLATFSGVEQQVQTNELLGSLAGTLGGSELTRLAGWVGMEARAAAPAAFVGAPVELETEPEAGATRAELRVRDSAGALWDLFDIPVSGGPLAWSGRREDGTAFPAATYSFEVVSYDGEGNVSGTSVPAAYHRVVEARTADGGAELVLDGGARVSATEITALREPLG